MFVFVLAVVVGLEAIKRRGKAAGRRRLQSEKLQPPVQPLDSLTVKKGGIWVYGYMEANASFEEEVVVNYAHAYREDNKSV